MNSNVNTEIQVKRANWEQLIIYNKRKKKKSASSIRDDGNLSQQWWLICNLSDGLDKQGELGSLSSYITEGEQTETKEREEDESREKEKWCWLGCVRPGFVPEEEGGSCMWKNSTYIEN